MIKTTAWQQQLSDVTQTYLRVDRCADFCGCGLSNLCRVEGVVQLLSVADTPQYFSLQFEPCLGGNLHQWLAREKWDEERVCAQVSLALRRGSSTAVHLFDRLVADEV